MPVTYSKLAARIHPRLGEYGMSLTPRQVQGVLRLVFHEIGEALASGEDVFLEGFGRFYPHYVPSMTIQSGITRQPHEVGGKIIVKFNAFGKLTKRVQDFLASLGVTGKGDDDDASTSEAREQG